MSLSSDLLAVLNHLDTLGGGFDPEYVCSMFDEAETYGDENTLTPEEIRGLARIRTLVRNTATSFVKSKMVPVGEDGPNVEELISAATNISGDDPLDEYFTRLALVEVPQMVKRARRLEAVGLKADPGRRVNRFFWQASSCYVYGFYDAVAVLSRAVVEGILEQQVGTRIPAPPPEAGKMGGSLLRLIDWATTCGILDDETRHAAHEARILGRKAIHAGGRSSGGSEPLNQLEARSAMISAVKVLRRLDG